MPRRYRTLHDAYIDNLRLVHIRPEHRASSRGNPCRERLNQAFVITRPRERAAGVALFRSMADPTGLAMCNGAPTARTVSDMMRA
jgi:hypothetical protein